MLPTQKKLHHGRASPPAYEWSFIKFTLQNVQCKTKRKTQIFSFIGSLSQLDKWHHHSGTCFKCRRYTVSVLLHRHILRGLLLPFWVIGSSKPRWPLTPTRLLKAEWSEAGLVGVISDVNAPSRRAGLCHVFSCCVKLLAPSGTPRVSVSYDPS